MDAMAPMAHKEMTMSNAQIKSQVLLVLTLVLPLVSVLGASTVAYSATQPSYQLLAVNAHAETININQADAETLARELIGVGQSRAKEIVRYRDTYGPFSSVEELMEVKGVGAKVVQRNQDRIVLE